MDKFKAGDKFILEVAKVTDSEVDKYMINLDEDTSWFVDEEFLMQLQQTACSGEEAWETAKQILFEKEFTHDILNEIFGTMNHYAIMRDLKPNEVKAKIDEWKKQKEEIKVGDVLKGKDSKMQCVVTMVNGNTVELLWKDGLTGKKNFREISDQFEKTGQSLNIENVLQMLGA